MPNVELLSHVEHVNLRLDAQALYAHNCDIGSAMIVPSEFAEVQREYPIFFRKDPETGRFFASAMLGLMADKNLFLKDGRWITNYVPYTLARGPFLIGFKQVQVNGGSEKTAVIYVDVDDARLSHEVGERLFDDEGQKTDELVRISQILSAIDQGVQKSNEMIQAFSDLALIEPVNLSVEFDDGEKLKISNIYSINEEKLEQLTAEALFSLNQAGFLRYAFSIVDSINNVQKLINIRNGVTI